MSLRDANVIIIETSRTVVRAGLGLFDLLKTPSVVRYIIIGMTVPENLANVDFPHRKYRHALGCEDLRRGTPYRRHGMEASLTL